MYKSILLSVLLAFSLTSNADQSTEDQTKDLPVYFYGVEACGNIVLWIITENDKIYRMDENHKPPNMTIEDAAKTLLEANIPNDVVVIDCKKKTFT